MVRLIVGRGDTFSFTFYPIALPTPDGVWDIRAHVRTTAGVLVQALTATLEPAGIDTPDGYTAVLEADEVATEDWPPEAEGDIEFSDNSVILHSEKFIIEVRGVVTHD